MLEFYLVVSCFLLVLLLVIVGAWSNRKKADEREAREKEMLDLMRRQEQREREEREQAGETAEE